MAWNPIPGIIENLVAEGIVAALVGGGVLVWLRKRASPWLVPICWGLGGFFVILGCFGALRIIATPLPHQIDAITTENVEAHLVQWIDAFHFSRQKLPDASDRYFTYVVTTESGGRTSVIRSRLAPFDHYLIMQTGITVDQENATRLHELSQRNSDLLIRDLRIEMARFKIGFMNIQLPLTTITLEKQLPITTDISEASFVQALDDVDSARVLLASVITKDLDELSKLH